MFSQRFFGPCTPLGMYIMGHVHLFACTSGPCTPLGMYMRGRPFQKSFPPNREYAVLVSSHAQGYHPLEIPQVSPHFTWMHRFQAPRSTAGRFSGHFCPTLGRFRLVFAPLDCFRVIFAQRLPLPLSFFGYLLFSATFFGYLLFSATFLPRWAVFG